jgi:hypothetical protein
MGSVLYLDPILDSLKLELYEWITIKISPKARSDSLEKTNDEASTIF